MRFAVFKKLLSVGSTSAQEAAAPDTDLPTAQNLQAIVQLFQLLSVMLHMQLQISSSPQEPLGGSISEPCLQARPMTYLGSLCWHKYLEQTPKNRYNRTIM